MRRNAVFLIGVFVLVLGGVAYAAIPAASGDVTACVSNGGTIRVIDAEAGQTCRSSETLLTLAATQGGKVANADLLDGQDSTDFLGQSHKTSSDHDGRYRTEAELGDIGTVNDVSNPVDWTKLKGVPSGLADGVDEAGGFETGVYSGGVVRFNNLLLLTVYNPRSVDANYSIKLAHPSDGCPDDLLHMRVDAGDSRQWQFDVAAGEFCAAQLLVIVEDLQSQPDPDGELFITAEISNTGSFAFDFGSYRLNPGDFARAR